MRKLAAYIIPLLLFALYSCNDSDGEGKKNPIYTVEPSTRHTFLVYMGIDNNFSKERIKIEALRKAWNVEYDANLIVYADGGNQTVLVHIHHDKYGDNVADTIQVYERENSADPEVFNRVLKKTFSEWPAEINGLLCVSHASGWMKEGKLNNPSRSTRTVLNDAYDGDDLDLWDFAENIPIKLDYIIFDACFMGGVEVMSELYGKTSRVVASSPEILAELMQYPDMISYLFRSSGPDLEGMMNSIYNITMSTSYPYIALSLTNVDNFTAMEDFCRSIFNGNYMNLENMFNLSDLQQFHPTYDFYTDLGDVVRAVSPGRYSEFLEVLDHCVEHTIKTDKYYSVYKYNPYDPNTHDIKSFSGLTMYVPQARYPGLNDDYKILKWYDRVYR